LKSENEIEYDEDIRKWKGGKRSWIPSIINEISIKPFFL
jgi:predicted AAA+ superfamily ATPase